MSTLGCRNPFTGDVLDTLPLATAAQAENAAARARAVQPSWSETPVPDRVRQLDEALHYFETNRDSVARDISLSMGKPLTQASNEVHTFFDRARYLLGVAEQALAPEIVRNDDTFRNEIHHAPLGLILVIAPWNYPLLTAVNSVLTALLAGNAVLLKHSSLTPRIGDHFARAFGQLPDHPGLLQHLIASHQVTGGLIEAGHVDHVSFTGSVGGGHAVYGHVATQFVRCNLELGGKDGAYVAADADIEVAAASLVDGAMYNAGQSCCGIERVLVHNDVYDDFVTRATEIAGDYQLGDPLDPATTMGPLADPESAAELRAQLDAAVAAGATIVVGGEPVSIGSGTFFQPTVITHVTADMTLMQEENFGPLMPIIRVANDDEAVAVINNSRYGLTAAIFTSDPSRARHFADRASAGTVFMNRCDFLDPALPWTGVRDSGMGSTLSQYGFYELTRRKAYHFKLKAS